MTEETEDLKKSLNLLLLPESKAFYSVLETAKLLCVSTQFIRDSIHSGALNAIVAPGRTLNKIQNQFHQ